MPHNAFNLEQEVVVMLNDELYEMALQSINNLFSDTSVSKETAKYNLESLIEEIKTMLESLED